MRIVSGTYKGRHIPVRKNFPSRPTTDFAKENLFNILNNHFNFEEITVLDLFSGTGSISYEFASRGAKVDLVEVDSRSIRFIRETLATLKIESVQAFRADVFKVVPKLLKAYDIIFADPPYQLPSIDTLPDLVLDTDSLKTGGWFILEHSDKHNFTGHKRFREIRKYGGVNFSVFT